MSKCTESCPLDAIREGKQRKHERVMNELFPVIKSGVKMTIYMHYPTGIPAVEYHDPARHYREINQDILSSIMYFMHQFGRVGLFADGKLTFNE